MATTKTTTRASSAKAPAAKSGASKTTANEKAMLNTITALQKEVNLLRQEIAALRPAAPATGDFVTRDTLILALRRIGVKNHQLADVGLL